MPGFPGALGEHLRSAEGRKKLRYAGASAVFLPLSQVIIQVFSWVTSWPDWLAILVTGCLLVVPSYYVNRIYVWRHGEPGSVRSHIAVFWVATMIGTLLAMGAGAVAEELTRGSTKLVHGAWLAVSQLSVAALVWIARYVFLDRWIFRVVEHEDPSSEDLTDLHRDFPY